MNIIRATFRFGLVLTGSLAFHACNDTGTDPLLGAPSALSYSPDTMVFAKGVADSGIGPDVTGTVTHYSVSPALPAGLTLDSAQGNIWGRGIVTSPATNYTVTARNAIGSATFSINLAVFSLDTTLSGLVQDIFNNDCVNCHMPTGIGYTATGGSSGGLDLSTGKAYANLVNQPTFEAPTKAPYLRVSSGSPDSSFLYVKIALPSSSQKSGLQMPFDGPPYLTEDEITIIKRWIESGVPQ